MYIALTRGAFKSVNMKYFIMKIPYGQAVQSAPARKNHACIECALALKTRFYKLLQGNDYPSSQ